MGHPDARDRPQAGGAVDRQHFLVGGVFGPDGGVWVAAPVEIERAVIVVVRAVRVAAAS